MLDLFYSEIHQLRLTVNELKELEKELEFFSGLKRIRII